MRMEFPRLEVFPIICLIIAAYFVYHGIYGARGYRRMHQVRQEIVQARQVAEEIRSKKEALSRRVDSLSAESLDMDQMEETAFRNLNMGSKADQVILLN